MLPADADMKAKLYNGFTKKGRNKKYFHFNFINSNIFFFRRAHSKYEMLPADSDMKAKLYQGFTKEEKGRYQYLKERKEILPELKYTFPVTSSLRYGWKLGDEVVLQKPRYARSRVVRDTFYTRNNIPDLTTHSMQRSMTFC